MQCGSTLIEVTLATAMIAFALVGVASAFGTNARAVGSARDLTTAARFLEETLDSLSAQAYDNLPALNGNVVYSETNKKDSLYSATINVSNQSVDLLRIVVVLRDVPKNSVITRIATNRARR